MQHVAHQAPLVYEGAGGAGHVQKGRVEHEASNRKRMNLPSITTIERAPDPGAVGRTNMHSGERCRAGGKQPWQRSCLREQSCGIVVQVLRAGLVAGEARAIEQLDPNSIACEPKRQAAAGRSGSHDDDVRRRVAPVARACHSRTNFCVSSVRVSMFTLYWKSTVPDA